MEILDYSTSEIIALKTGRARVKNGNYKIIHDINLEKYEDAIEEVNTELQTPFIKNHTLYHLLDFELTQVTTQLKKLKHKNRRSLDFLGSAWKWIAGSPDHEDFITIKEKINNVLTNNNRQTVVNDLFQSRLNQLDEYLNKLNNKVESKENNEFIAYLQYRLKLIKEDLININYAIHWARHKIINSMIISYNETELLVNILKEEKLPYESKEEALEFSDVKILTNNKIMLYIINIPKTNGIIFNKYFIKPVKKFNRIVEIPENVIISQKFNEFYSIEKECKNFGDLMMCDRNNLKLIKDDCLKKLINSQPAECKQVNAQHLPMIEEIDDGLLLLNNFNGVLKESEAEKKLNGTFLIKFSNTTITVNNEQYVSIEKTTIQELPVYLQRITSWKQTSEILSLQMMKELHINNTQQIELLANENNTNNILSYISISTVGIIIISLTTILVKIILNKKSARNNRPGITQDNSKIESSLEDKRFEGGRVNVTH